jgi:MFS family permease
LHKHLCGAINAELIAYTVRRGSRPGNRAAPPAFRFGFQIDGARAKKSELAENSMSATDRLGMAPKASLSSFVALVGILGASYAVSQFLRNSVGVIAPNISEELGISAAQIGVLSSVFFFAFAAAQLPLGIAIDRYGPKRCMLACGLVVILGAILFATASTWLGLIAARFLMGIGTSCYLMAPLALYARTFKPDRFATLAGLQLGLGSLGTLMATAPLGLAAAAVGWRATFLIVGGMVAVLGVLIAVIVDNIAASLSESRQETLTESLAGIGEALRARSVVRLFVMHMACYSSFVLVVGLWGGPYLSHIYGYDLATRGSLLLIPASTQVIGLVIWGHADRLLRSHQLPVLLGAGSTCALFFLLAAVGRMPPIALTVWLALFGFCSACLPVVIAHGKSLFAPRLVGRGMTLLNMGTMFGAFASQIVSGAVIDIFPEHAGMYPLDAYRLIFGLQAAFILCAIGTYLGAYDPRREQS